MREVSNVVLVRNDRVLLLRRNPERTNFPNVWGFPGGHREPEETLEQTIVRESYEELGIVLLDLSYVHCFQIDHDGERICFHVFVSRRWSGDIRLIGDEHSDFFWPRMNEVDCIDNIALSGYRDAIRKIE